MPAHAARILTTKKHYRTMIIIRKRCGKDWSEIQSESVEKIPGGVKKESSKRYLKKSGPRTEYRESKSISEERSFAKKEAKLRSLGRKADRELREAVKGSEVEKKVVKILNRSNREMAKTFSDAKRKPSRERVPKKTLKKVEKSGVIQKDSEGNWRIINMHNPGGPVFWRAKYASKEKAQNTLKAFHSGAWGK